MDGIKRELFENQVNEKIVDWLNHGTTSIDERCESIEKGLLDLVKNEKPEILEAIQKSGKIEEDVDKILSETITNYKKTNFEKK